MFTRTESFQQFIKFYPAVTIFAGIILIAFLLTSSWYLPGHFFFEKLAGVNLYIAQGEYWRLITPIFVHSSFSHLLFNAFSLVIFGPALERITGSFLFSLFFLAAGLAANAATYLIQPLTYTHVGASGAIYGILGFFLFLVLLKKDRLSKQNSQTILTLVAVGLIMTFIQPQINVLGHLGGLTAGFLLAPAFLYIAKEERR
ncbi:rhomboid family intramembrane serine protease [Peribacillus saganii]|uniref:Rhomboid family intramembrane serine protease n=1 Tax=Peribacillus saganii TaxID=2303992 RepID=A0A372LMU5_9BACI|nr:rhomboid family intramembrane serine protease [Peribacillus saganii]RFU67388.1 rhomboid family intramembrane serine protease [Peribacillus saganii]